VSAGGFILPAGVDTTHVLVGRYSEGGYVHPGILLMRCDATQCQQTPVWLDFASELAGLALVDLRGEPGPLSALPAVKILDSNTHYAQLSKPDRPRWPALVVRTRWHETMTTESGHGTVTGAYSKDRLFLLSLLQADAERPALLSEDIRVMYPTGIGQTTELYLQRGKGAFPLALVGSIARHLANGSGCIEPKPFAIRYRLLAELFTVTREGKPATVTYRHFEREPTPEPPGDGCH
jgi:hypothetical protein